MHIVLLGFVVLRGHHKFVWISITDLSLTNISKTNLTKPQEDTVSVEDKND